MEVFLGILYFVARESERNTNSSLDYLATFFQSFSTCAWNFNIAEIKRFVLLFFSSYTRTYLYLHFYLF